MSTSTKKRKAYDVFLDLTIRAAEAEALFGAIEDALLGGNRKDADNAVFLAGVGKRLADSTGAIADCAAFGQFDKWTTEFNPPPKKKAVAATV